MKQPTKLRKSWDMEPGGLTCMHNFSKALSALIVCIYLLLMFPNFDLEGNLKPWNHTIKIYKHVLEIFTSLVNINWKLTTMFSFYYQNINEAIPNAVWLQTVQSSYCHYYYFSHSFTMWFKHFKEITVILNSIMYKPILQKSKQISTQNNLYENAYSILKLKL